MQVEGNCHCQLVTFRSEIIPNEVEICHCTDCQSLSGSAFHTIVPVTSQLKSGKIAGVAFSVAQNEEKNGAYIAFSADKCFSIPFDNLKI